MYMSQDKQKRASEWLQQKLSTMACPLCGSKEHRIGDTLVLPIRFPDTKADVSSAGYPVIPLECTNCAQVVMLSAKRVLG